MKGVISLIGCFLSVFILSVIIHIPTSFALKFAPAMSGLEVDLESGTLWNGSAENIRWKDEDFGQVHWQFHPIKLLLGKVEYSLQLGRGSDANIMAKGDVGVSFGGLYAKNIVASIPAKEILERTNVAFPITVEGTAELSVAEYYHAEPWCESAQGSLVWNGSKISSPLGELDLGTIIMDLNCVDNTLSLVGDHSSSEISGAIEAELKSNMQYDINAWFKPADEFPKNMKSQLKWLSPPNNRGEYPLSFSGRIK